MADTEALVLSISADIAGLRRALARATGDTKAAANQMAASFDTVGSAAQRTGQRVNQMDAQIAAGSRAARAATQNLSFQLNDISQGLLAGTSPFTIMIQQSSQVAQAFQQAGGGIGALGTALKSAFSPTALVISGLILAAGYVADYFRNVEEGAPSATEALKKHAETIASFDEAFNRAKDGLKQYSDAAKALIGLALKDDLAATKGALEDLIGGLKSGGIGRLVGLGQRGILDIPIEEFNGATHAVQLFDQALQKLEGDTPDVRGFVQQMIEIENMTGLPDPIKALAKEFRLAAADGVALADQAEEIQKRLDTVMLTSEKARVALAALIQTFTGLGTVGPEAANMIAEAFNTKVVPAIQATIEAAQNATKFLEQMAQTPLGTLPPLVSGGGQFLNPEELQRFKAGEAGLAAMNKEMEKSIELIKQREGFITNAKWDVNAFRVGFGSDTITDEMGRVTKVTKDTVTTVAAANRDLQRRIGEFQAGIKGAIGGESWAALTEEQQAALTSIAYNYGSLPKRIVDAIQQGGGPGVVSKAIEALGADNGGMNKKRRLQEAALFGGAEFTAEKAPDKAKTNFDELFAQNQQRLEQLQYETKVRGDSTMSIDAQTVAIEKNKIAQDLLNAAKAQGLPITDELTKKIDAQAQAMAEAGLKTDQLKTKQKEASQASKEFGQQVAGIAQSAISGFVNDLRNGVSAGDAFANMLDRVIDGLLNMAIQSLFSQNALGGVFGNLFGGGGGLGAAAFHGGGTVGLSGRPRGGGPAALWNGAPRMHAGGANLGPGEMRAILKKGEVVVPPMTRIASANRGRAGDTINNQLGNVSIDMSGTGVVAAGNEQARQFGENVRAIVQVEMVRESRPGGLLRRTG